jgi:uncharacterized protein (DUF983 family)
VSIPRPDKHYNQPMRKSLRGALLNGVRRRCPYCHQGAIFRGRLNRVLPQCPVCRLPYFRESGYFLGGMIITYILTAFVLVAVYLFSLLLPGVWIASENTKFALWIVFAILLTLVLVQPAYSLWLSLDFWIDPWEPEEPK